jgi:hypothetical protein
MKIVNKIKKQKKMLEIDPGLVIKADGCFHLVTSHRCDCVDNDDHVLIINLEDGESQCVTEKDVFEVADAELVIK